MAASTAVTVEDTPRDADASTRSAQVAALTGLRGFAALMVVVVHVSALTEYAWLGVASYGPVSLFVLSGYLLYRPWARWGLGVAPRPSVRVFARRRLARIFPAYLVVVLAVAAIHPPTRPGTVSGWLHLVTLTWIYESGNLPPALLQTWSLATELSWYVALPLMAGVTARIARSRSPRTGFWTTAALIGLALPITAGWRWWNSVQDLDNGVPYSLWLPAYLVCFAGGAAVALVAEGRRAGVVTMHRVHTAAGDPWALPILALAAALLGTSALGGPPGFPETFGQEEIRTGCAAVVAVTLLAAVVLGSKHSPVSRLLSTAWCVAIGRWSYGIFLWHLPLIVIMQGDVTWPTGPVGVATRLLVVLGISVPLGAVTYRYVELPAIRWSQRLPGGTFPRASRSGTQRGVHRDRVSQRHR